MLRLGQLCRRAGLGCARHVEFGLALARGGQVGGFGLAGSDLRLGLRSVGVSGLGIQGKQQGPRRHARAAINRAFGKPP